MASKHIYDQNHREYVSLSAAYVGHLMTSSLLTPLAGLMYGLLSYFFPVLNFGIQNLVIFIIAVVIVGELIVVLIQRPFIIKASHSDPGGWGYALPEFLVLPCLAGLGAFLISRELSAGLVCALAFFIVFGVAGLLSKPWTPGLSRAEIRERYEQTKDMIQAGYIEEKYRDVEVDPSHRDLFKKR
ncbi:hypothetical protein [Rothia sp. CCM 9419]|uniref:hypothetical protein n=1 Tax=Rothia sp. CCM 9419 TaxID=3402662 RepID=UPI003ADED979